MVRIERGSLGPQYRVREAILFSILVHSVLILTLLNRSPFNSLTSPPHTIDVELVSPRREPHEESRNQVAETSLADRSEKAAKDAYLGRQTQVVSKQTRASTIAPFSEGRNGEHSATSRRAQTPALSALGVKILSRPSEPQNGGGPTPSDNNALADPEGSQTLLNTTEYAYFSFFERVRHQVEQLWEPNLRRRLIALSRNERRLVWKSDHETGLTVIMDRRGNITRVIVNGSSGVYEIDQAAIDSFNRNGAFPNPPRGLISQDGTVRIAWRFILRT